MNKEVEKLINMATIFDTFKYIPRLGTKRIPIDLKENVALHIYEMMYLAYLVYYSLDYKYKQEYDLIDIYNSILVHELDEALTNDIPYPAKKLFRKANPRIMANMEEVTHDYIYDISPNCIKPNLGKYSKIVNNQTSLFVKALDYVNLYLNCIKISRMGYNLSKTIEECKNLTINTVLFDQSELIRSLIDTPELFIDQEFN